MFCRFPSHLLAFLCSSISHVTICIVIDMVISCLPTQMHGRVLKSIAKINSLHFLSPIRDERVREKGVIMNAF